ncbi:MAG: GAF domain-containing sensor histidine kinase, partial [Burkholderiales bacterium]|nr:GAF domain-containing sensor histidine kinase [Burkholderiales bacterium]
HAALCARMQREILISSGENSEQNHDQQNHHDDCLTHETTPCLSAMFGPLATGKRNLGVMTIQSRQPAAYGEREELIFRNLCSYGAIALDNAYAYKKLQEAQIQLVEQEKLAALGSLVAGVAHELNTPLGNSLVTATGLQDYGDHLQMQLENQSLRLCDLEEFIARQREGMDLILRGLHSAANLVVSFKQVAADRTTAQRRFFDLQQTTHEVVATMNSLIRADGHRILVDIPPNIQLDSYPGPYGQVITSFINNAVCHAFPSRRPGQITLRATQPKAGRVLITFGDNGVGIEACNLKRIFDPFFTTSLGQGGNGLGLSISYNIVTSMLQGHISVESTPGEGAVFILDLPLTVEA